MISRYDVALNGQHMNEIDENLLILDVNYLEPTVERNETTIGYGDGTLVDDERVRSASVTISFELHIYSTPERQSTLQKVNSWARTGGYLEINDREGQQLYCVCTKYPSIDSVKKWTNPLSITFTAFKVPYWEESSVTSATLSGRNASGNFELSGNGGDALVSCSIRAGGTLTSLKITVGNTYIELSGISVPNGGYVNISYDTDKNIVITTNGVSGLGKRTGPSSDSLMAPSGSSTRIAVLANVTVTATFSARGCWM